MQFNSLTYIIFFLTVYLAYRFVSHRLQNMLLLIASYIFYAWWDVRFLFLIVLSTVVNYCCGIIIQTGAISLKQRISFSIWIILTYFFTVLLQWNHLPAYQKIFTTHIDWIAFTDWEESWKIFLTLCITIVFFNLLYLKIVLLDEKRKKVLFLFLGVSANLLMLGGFKYYNFFIDNIEWFLSELSMNPARFHLDIILPIGISFYTFKGIGYVIDVYRGNIKTTYRYTDFALFIAFFPSLLAGPIDRGAAFLQQICEKRKLTWEQSLRGMHLFFYGLFKKVVIADGVIGTVNSVFDSTGQPSWIDVVVATVLFTIQIYCDFSGYTDMARGTAKLFGIDLMVNFNLPYFSKNPREFWSRWHISLSSWLRDYLYIPLGGNRQGTFKTNRNLIITMVLGGLWHGAAWNFVLWGLYHGLVLIIHRAIGAIRSASQVRKNMLSEGFKIICFFMAICYGWLLFRSPSLDKVMSLTSTLIIDFGNMHFGALRPAVAALLGLPVFLCIELIEYTSNSKSFYQKLPIPAWTALYALMIFGLILCIRNKSAQFIYFTF